MTALGPERELVVRDLLLATIWVTTPIWANVTWHNMAQHVRTMNSSTEDLSGFMFLASLVAARLPNGMKSEDHWMDAFIFDWPRQGMTRIPTVSSNCWKDLSKQTTLDQSGPDSSTSTAPDRSCTGTTWSARNPRTWRLPAVSNVLGSFGWFNHKQFLTTKMVRRSDVHHKFVHQKTAATRWLVRDEVLHQAFAHRFFLGEGRQPFGATVPLLEADLDVTWFSSAVSRCLTKGSNMWLKSLKLS